MSAHQQGLLFAFFGALVLSFDAMLIRLADTSEWQVLFWRGGLIAIAFGILTWLFKQRIVYPSQPHLWFAIFAIALMYGLNTTLFVYAVSHTSTANTVVILASSPLFAALFSRLFLQERLALRTLLTIAVAFVGVVSIVYQSLGSGHLNGDLAALALAISMGAVLTALRCFASLPLFPIIALSGVVAAVLAMLNIEVAPLDIRWQQAQWLLIMGAIQIPLATWLLMSATRLLPSAEVSLFLLIETVFGPGWVWLAVNEAVPENTLFGGTLILGAISLNSVITLAKQKNRTSEHR